MTVIAVASGKGGTGKTTVATSIALALSDLAPVLLDCDVEAPNAHISLRARFDKQQKVTVPIPDVDQSQCSGCGRCAEVCQYHAIVAVGGKVLVFPQLCHGCGSCSFNCPEGAIQEIPRTIGQIEAGRGMAGIRIARGVLNIGEPMAVPVIRALKEWGHFPSSGVVIRDVPPGTSCPVVESIRGADFVLLVTEPTPFGLHDLRLAVQMTEEINLPMGVVINRDGVGDDSVEAFCQEEQLPILMRIPLERHIGEALALGAVLVEAFPEYLPDFLSLYQQILFLVKEGETALKPASISGVVSP